MPIVKLLPTRYRRMVRRTVKKLRGDLQYHYMLPLSPPVGYCYIRKNACSAFTRLIRSTSPQARLPEEASFDFMNRCHRLDHTGAVAAARMIFVIRDPLDRVLSGYVQQIVRSAFEPYSEMEASIRAITGQTRAELSFEDFVVRYLGAEDFSRINVHFTPQIAHLGPLRYTDVLLDKRLAEDAAQIFGAEIADAYFRTPVNAMSQIARHGDPEAWRQPAGELCRRLEATGSLPERGDLLTPALKARLSEIYAADLALFARYTRLRAAAPDQPPALDMRDHDFLAHFSHNRAARRGLPRGLPA